ncbi:MAG TPA: DUF6760 family protein [Vicinamibacterales bacterium]|nr:DUF6760 family protein [Vicinamibacterales bacterium]
MIGYPSGRLLEEVAYVAYYLHWPYHEIMAMDHRERRWWIAEVSRIHDRLNEADQIGR